MNYNEAGKIYGNIYFIQIQYKKNSRQSLSSYFQYLKKKNEKHTGKTHQSVTFWFLVKSEISEHGDLISTY